MRTRIIALSEAASSPITSTRQLGSLADQTANVSIQFCTRASYRAPSSSRHSSQHSRNTVVAESLLRPENNWDHLRHERAQDGHLMTHGLYRTYFANDSVADDQVVADEVAADRAPLFDILPVLQESYC